MFCHKETNVAAFGFGFVTRTKEKGYSYLRLRSPPTPFAILTRLLSGSRRYDGERCKSDSHSQLFSTHHLEDSFPSRLNGHFRRAKKRIIHYSPTTTRDTTGHEQYPFFDSIVTVLPGYFFVLGLAGSRWQDSDDAEGPGGKEGLA